MCPSSKYTLSCFWLSWQYCCIIAYQDCYKSITCDISVLNIFSENVLHIRMGPHNKYYLTQPDKLVIYQQWMYESWTYEANGKMKTAYTILGKKKMLHLTNVLALQNTLQSFFINSGNMAQEPICFLEWHARV